MKAIIVDDEQGMRENLKALLSKYTEDIQVIGESDGVRAGLNLLGHIKPDILFLDIEMKDGTGFDLLSRYGEADFKVIFVTGHNQYAIRAFKYSAIDYLIKPVDPIELKESVAKVQRSFKSSQQLNNLIENQSRSEEEKKVVLKDAESVYLIPVKEITRCESDNNYTIFWLNDGRKLMISKTLKEYEKLFEDQLFFRVHQSHLINLNFFDRYDKREGGTIFMKDGTTVPLSTRKKDAFLERLSSI